MKKRGFVALVFLILIVLLPLILAASVDDEIKKITHYAEEYETGNINYVQLLIYTSAVRQNLNEILGATGKEAGGLLKQEQLKPILGEPTDVRKWVWVEKEEREKRVDYDVPVWEKIIFDGEKIQIKLEAWPSLFTKGNEESLVYRLNFMINFKNPEEQLDIQGKISQIKTLAQTFNSDPSTANAEALAKESVNIERIFESYYRQNPGKCEDIMNSVFGSENQRQTQKLLVQQVSFYQGEDYEVIARLEMCDDCEWSWINLDLWLEGRGPGFKSKEENLETFSPKDFMNMDSSSIKEEITNLLKGIKQCFEQGGSKCLSQKQKLNALNWAWNDKSNNIWPEVDKEYEEKRKSLSEEEMQKLNENYGWIKQEQEKRKRVKELMKKNYEERKQFYLDLFSGYEKKEYYFTQVEWEKRLIEEFKEFGKEICDNNKDDNEDGAVDCGDGQCGGKFCGKGTITMEGNETREEEINLYCISGECKAREEKIKIKEIVCGNHICEENETKETCSEDCSLCLQYPAIKCSGKVIFKGKDENNCPLDPICIEETQSCVKNEDCLQPLCGKAECIEEKCHVTELTECREEECVDGDEKIINCTGGEKIVTEKCIEKIWIKTNIDCFQEITETPENIITPTEKEVITAPEESISGNQCIVREDCGGENDVCSNGNCITIPQRQEQTTQEEQTEQPPQEEQGEQPTEQEETQQPQPEQPSEEEQPEQTETSSETTGAIIFNFINSILSRMRITGAVITGFEVEETQPTIQTSEPQPSETDRPEPNQQNQEQNQQPPQDGQQDLKPEQQPYQQPDNQQPREEFREENKEQDEDREKMEAENRERCEKECRRPCVEECIRKNCGEEMECDVDEESKKCEGSCEADDSCVEKCMKGGDWWQEFENKEQPKQEKGVFKAGGNCRTSQGKTESFIYFDGWGEPFEKIQPLKQKYYSGGQADWCKYELENLKKQRQEFEKSFNQEFVTWFFEKYLVNSAENWEQSVSGIFELYWKDVDNSREIAYRMNCLEIDSLPEVNLINVKYDTQYGSLEFWEEIKTAKLPGIDGEINVISPYMKIWIFPPKKFMIYEMKQSMKNHEFPGSPEEKMNRKNEEGLTSEEKQQIREDEGEMEKIQKLSQKYGGSFDALIQFKDFTTGEVVFNIYAQINEKDLITIKPMPLEEVPSEDARAEIDFEKIYELIYSAEKEMRGAQTESPPWDRKINPVQKVKEAVNGVKMWFKMRSIINSAKYYPADSEGDLKPFLKTFFMTMGGPGAGGPGEGEPEDKEGNENVENIESDVLESKEVITGEVIAVD